MAHGYTPGQMPARDELYAVTSIGDGEVGEGDQRTGEDHFAHAAGKICIACGRTIEAGQAARRRGETGWVHDVCPVVTD